MTELKLGIINMIGWKLEYREQVKGRSLGIGMIEDGSFAYIGERFGPDVFPQREGYIIGHHIGPDSVIPGVDLKVELSDAPNSRHRFLVDMRRMYEMELTPPDPKLNPYADIFSDDISDK